MTPQASVCKLLFCSPQDGDAVVLFNFRADRMVEISKAFEYENFSGFERKRFPKVRCTHLRSYFQHL